MEITVGDFIEMLEKEDPYATLDFSGLDFYRLKDRGGCIQVEFNQTVGKDENGLVYVVNHDLVYLSTIDRDGNRHKFDVRSEVLVPSQDCQFEGTSFTIFDRNSPVLGFTFEVITVEGIYFVKYADNNLIPNVSEKGIFLAMLRALSTLYKQDIYSSTNYPSFKLYSCEGLVGEMSQAWKRWESLHSNVKYVEEKKRYVFKYDPHL